MSGVLFDIGLSGATEGCVRVGDSVLVEETI